LTVMTGATVTALAGCSSDEADENGDEEIEAQGDDDEIEVQGPTVEIETDYEIETQEEAVSDEIYAVGTVENIDDSPADVTLDFELYEEDGEYNIPILEELEGVEPGEEREFRLGPANIDEEDLEDTEVNANAVRTDD